MRPRSSTTRGNAADTRQVYFLTLCSELASIRTEQIDPNRKSNEIRRDRTSGIFQNKSRTSTKTRENDEITSIMKRPDRKQETSPAAGCSYRPHRFRPLQTAGLLSPAASSTTCSARARYGPGGAARMSDDGANTEQRRDVTTTQSVESRCKGGGWTGQTKLSLKQETDSCV